MFRPTLAAVLFTAAAFASSCEPSTAPADEIVAAERAFAADGYARGVKLSFLAYSAPDAVIFSPGPVNAHESLNASPDENLAEPRAHLVWWPLYAGAAQSGDLGFTTGPFAVDENRRGHYFTIWKKQDDGAWKWVLDAGVGADASNEAPQGSPAAILKGGSQKSSSPEAAMKEVAIEENALAVAALSGVQSAYGPYLDEGSRLHSSGPPPSKSAEDRQAAFAARPQTLAFTPLGGGASKAGDFVWTYGEGRWRENDAERTGYYVRIWRKQRSGWRIVFDEFLPPRQG